MLKQELQALMPETLNHRLDCKTSFDICQQEPAIADFHDLLCAGLELLRLFFQPAPRTWVPVYFPFLPPLASLVALFSVRRAISWPGPLGQSSLVLARLHRSRPPPPAGMPAADRRASRSTARLDPSCRVSGLFPRL
jgi:hypothetical protein